jgi:beta-galactosidase
MELWNGKALLTGNPTQKRDLNEVKISVESAMECADLMNLYMYHGGTNFGFFNGAQYQNGKYTSHATSYDVQTPLGEYGNKTEKYYLEQKIICDYLGKKIINNTKTPVLINYGNADYVCKMPLSELDECYYSVHHSKNVLPMEKFDQAHGCIAYLTNVQTDEGVVTLEFNEIHDHLSVFVDNKLTAEISRDNEKKVELSLSKGNHELTFFVQEFGRINFGKEIFDKNGLKKRFFWKDGVW